jgi:hypothetical protein
MYLFYILKLFSIAITSIEITAVKVHRRLCFQMQCTSFPAEWDTRATWSIPRNSGVLAFISFGGQTAQGANWPWKIAVSKWKLASSLCATLSRGTTQLVHFRENFFVSFRICHATPNNRRLIVCMLIETRAHFNCDVVVRRVILSANDYKRAHNKRRCWIRAIFLTAFFPTHRLSKTHSCGVKLTSGNKSYSLIWSNKRNFRSSLPSPKLEHTYHTYYIFGIIRTYFNVWYLIRIYRIQYSYHTRNLFFLIIRTYFNIWYFIIRVWSSFGINR